VAKQFAQLEKDNPVLAQLRSGKPLAVDVVDSTKSKGMKMARMVRALAISGFDKDKAAEYAKDAWPESGIEKTILAGDASSGGVLVPGAEMGEMIELLRPASTFMNAGPRIIPMTNGTLKMPKLKGGAVARWLEENAVIQLTEQIFGTLNLVFKKLGAIVPISRDFLRFASPGSDAVIRDDIVAAMGEAKDIAFIRGDGLQASPKGTRSWAPAVNIFAANGTVNLANITSDLGTLILKLMEANVIMRLPHLFFAPRTFMFLMTIRDGNGNLAFKDEMVNGTLMMIPFSVTNQIPINLGGGGDESEIILVDMADAIVGVAEQLIIEESTEAAYDDGGTIRSAFSQDQMVVKVIEETDLGYRHTLSIAVMTEVTWAP
jgi:HK97 family phage major capsid protein